MKIQAYLVDVVSGWLKCSDEIQTPHTSISHYQIKEKHLPDSEIKSELSYAIMENHVNTALLQNALTRYSWDQVRSRLIEPSMPTSDKIRKGRFGEILTGLLLSDFLGYYVPVKKNQFAITANQSLPATDLLIVKLENDSVVEISFIESKLRTSNDSTAAVKAYDQLKKDEINRFMDMSLFVLKRLSDNDEQLQYDIMNYIFENEASGIIRTLGISLVYDEHAWDDNVIQNLCSHVPHNESNIFVISTCVANLRELILELLEPFKLNLGDTDE